MGVPKKRAGKKKPARPPQQLTAEEHFENAEMAFAMENLDQARASFKRALDLEPENVEYLEGYGSFLAEVGPQAEAVAVLRRAVAQQPDEGFEKFMYLGQLVEDPAEAEQCVRKGLAVLRAYMAERAAQPAAAEASEEAAEAAMERQHLDATLCSCLCSLAEVLMAKAQAGGDGTLAAVEAEVESALGEARALAPGSPEPLQALASLRQQQDKDEEALALLRQSMALWFKPLPDSDSEGEGEGEEEEEGAAAGGAAAQRAAAPAAAAAREEGLGSEGASSEGGSGSGSDAEDMDEGSDSGDEELPSYEFRFETAKLLLELDDSVDAASQVLEGLLEENDEDPHVWLLLAMCCQGGGDMEGALGAVEEGVALCKKLGLPPTDQMRAGFEAMQGELRAMLKEAAEGGEGKGGAAAAAAK